MKTEGGGLEPSPVRTGSLRWRIKPLQCLAAGRLPVSFSELNVFLSAFRRRLRLLRQ